jgi:hypothetical protein
MPLPLAIVINVSLIWLVGPDRWGIFHAWLFDAYSSVGLLGVPYSFSWSWMTVFLLQFALPYTILALFIRQQLLGGGWRSWQLSAWPADVLKWCVVLLFPLPATLALCRVLLPALPPAWFSPPGALSFWQKYLHGVLCQWVTLGIPYAAVSVLLHDWLFRGSRPTNEQPRSQEP